MAHLDLNNTMFCVVNKRFNPFKKVLNKHLLKIILFEITSIIMTKIFQILNKKVILIVIVDIQKLKK